jgi:hypothetical protein
MLWESMDILKKCQTTGIGYSETAHVENIVESEENINIFISKLPLFRMLLKYEYVLLYICQKCTAQYCSVNGGITLKNAALKIFYSLHLLFHKQKHWQLN